MANIAAVHSSAMVWPVWLEIAFAHLKQTNAARKRLTGAGDYGAEGVALGDEFRNSLQTGRLAAVRARCDKRNLT